ncbi:SusE domain-containing protein [Pontibacter liquoris]|uniref:SusE domain-containing protein n=1 Tax=Pontibacter liquoris TaxID=2905677 RepID=UPI001FA76CD0|nr:SusE domain-containing protein [Pontibacter liquoris]
MKTWIKQLFILSALSLVLFSCEKDEDRAILNVGAAPALTASSTNLILLEEAAKNEAITLTWTEADYGFDAAVNYQLQIDTAGDNFVKPYSADLGSTLSKTYTVEELNTLMTKLKYTPEEPQEIKIRIKASVSEFVDPVYSNVAAVTVTPYSTFIEPTFIYVPGDYQGWAPDKAPALVSVEANGIYTGIISFAGTNNRKFKFTPERDWDMDYGMGSTPTSLKEKGSDLEVPANDVYKITADLNNLTWSFARYSWGIIGDATAGGWDSDQDMQYVNGESIWKATLILKAGKIKFRLNDAWDVNYGDDNVGDDALNAGGADIPVASAGTYEITFKLDQEGVASYTIVKK